MDLRKIIDYFGLPIYCALIFWLSSQSTLPKHDILPFQDKWDHLAAYAIMTLLAIRSMVGVGWSKSAAYAAGFLFCAAYGLSDEWHQSFVTGRESSMLDFSADIFGVLAAIAGHGAFSKT